MGVGGEWTGDGQIDGWETSSAAAAGLVYTCRPAPGGV